MRWKDCHPDLLSQSVLHTERTIDEMYFPSLSSDSLMVRDKSQVVSREHNENEKPILVVPNIWISRLGKFVFIAFSTSDDSIRDEIFDVRNITPLQGPGIDIGRILSYQVSSFGHRQANGEFPAPLDIFERSVIQILQEVDEYTSPRRVLRPEIEREQNFMFRISDIREELVMIQEVLHQQLEVFERFIDDYETWDPKIKELLRYDVENSDLTVEMQSDIAAWEEVKNTKTTIQRFQKRVKKIDGDAERVEKRIQDQLNLKRTHISINDARSSLLLGTAVIGFTVITVIFAPLAFMTALFALPIDTLVRNQFLFDRTGGNTDAVERAEPTPTYTARYVGTWFGKCSYHPHQRIHNVSSVPELPYTLIL